MIGTAGTDDSRAVIDQSGSFLDLLLPSTDAGVAVQAIVLTAVFTLLLVPARRLGIVQLWAGTALVTAGLFVLRSAH